jgi:hypothetical protein
VVGLVESALRSRRGPGSAVPGEARDPAPASMKAMLARWTSRNA